MYCNHSGYFTAGLSAIVAMCATGYASDARAATVQVTNCNDSGPGSLRDGVAAASSGDTVDLRDLRCRRITLTSGAIDIPQASLAIRGSGFDRMVVNGNYTSPVLRHSGLGTLSLSGLTISRGHLTAKDAQGGCVYSAGNANVVDVQVHDCGAFGDSRASGGGMYIAGDLRLFTSAVYDNRAAAGGGLRVLGNLRAHRVRITGNIARGFAGEGGGFRVDGGATITYATIAANVAGKFSGGGEIFETTYIANSTISGNSAGEQIGGMVTGDETTIINTTFSGNVAPFISAAQIPPGATVTNSTFAFNREETDLSCLAAVYTYGEIHLESTVVARNTCNGAPGWDVNGSGTDESRVIGADNLIESAYIPLPADTIRADPMLLPLAENGGPTLTHALMAASPALDHGNNVLGLDNDQRGAGFPRVNGGRNDIGALEH